MRGHLPLAAADFDDADVDLEPEHVPLLTALVLGEELSPRDLRRLEQASLVEQYAPGRWRIHPTARRHVLRTVAPSRVPA